LIAIGLTIADHVASAFGFGGVFEWTWKISQWPLAFGLVSTAIGLVYSFAAGCRAGLGVDHAGCSDAVRGVVVGKLREVQLEPE